MTPLHPARLRVFHLRLDLLASRLRIPGSQCRRAFHGTVACSKHVRTPDHNSKIEHVRNIGIIAHIDAGKTTTTEQMLHLSGAIYRAGDITSGDTITDFLPLEQARGITIQSAAITFQWPNPETAAAAAAEIYTFNLVDTPGHYDFRFEVDRCMPILDLSVCVLDGTKGVEPHSERVWDTAHQYRVPRIIFVNKLDLDGVAFSRTVREVAARLGAHPLVCHLPWWNKDQFTGIIDVVNQVAYRWTRHGDHATTKYGTDALAGVLGDVQFAEFRTAWQRLIEEVANHDDQLAEMFLDDPDRITADVLKQSIRRLVAAGDAKVAPIFAGSSKLGVGVPQLMDAIIDYGPNPAERPDVQVQLPSGEQTSMASALKSVAAEQKEAEPPPPEQKVSDKRHKKAKSLPARIESVSTVFKVWQYKDDVFCFVRVCYGILSGRAQLWNTRLGEAERPMGLAQIQGNQPFKVEALPRGYIGGLRGLRRARTGDTIITTYPHHRNPPKPASEMMIRPPRIPVAVTTLVIETRLHTLSERVREALEHMSREDPSLQWFKDPHQERFIIQGMGGLHLFVARDTLRHRLADIVDKLTLGEIEPEYRESVAAPTGEHRGVYEQALAGKQGKAACTASIEPWEEEGGAERPPNAIEVDGNLVLLNNNINNNINNNANNNNSNHSSKDAAGSTASEELAQQLISGARSGMSRGPRLSFPVQQCIVKLDLDTSPGSTETPTAGHVSNAARTAVRAALEHAHGRDEVCVLEPVMDAIIRVPQDALGAIQHDLTSRVGGTILSVEAVQGMASQTDIDPDSVYAPPDPYVTVRSQQEDGVRAGSRIDWMEITALVPVATTMDYSERIKPITKDRQSVSLSFNSYKRMFAHRAKELESKSTFNKSDQGRKK